ncbi:MAG: leucine-rich repeat protein [Muribaculaceae bacterium]|nr:leucine-rich repeat protein [Muribaculaceae bacterium]
MKELIYFIRHSIPAIRMIALAIFLCLPAMVSAQIVTVGNLKYSLSSSTKTASVLGLADASIEIHNLTIPSEVTYNNAKYSVVEIGVKAFWNCTNIIGHLTIPNSVMTIGNSAFFGCSGFTGTLTIPNSVTTIGISAFEECSGFKGDLTIPNSVNRIDVSAFRHCSGFTGTLTIPNSVTSISYAAFEGCSGFTGDLIIPNSVTKIGGKAFYECSGFTGALTIPNSVNSIDGSAFYKCSGFTGSLTIPNSVAYIGDFAFFRCYGIQRVECTATRPPTVFNDSFSNFSIALFVPCESWHAYKTANIWKRFSKIKPIFGIALDPIMAKVIVGESLTITATVHDDQSVTWSSSDETVATVDATGKVVGIKIGITTITATTVNGLSAECKVVVDDDTPFTFTYNEAEKTATVTGLKSPDTPLVNPVIPDITGHNGEEYIVTAIGNEAFKNNTLLSGTLTISKNITSIGDYAFYDCSGFTGTLTIPNSVTTIDEWAFSGCSGFTGDLTIPNSVTTIGARAFEECPGFTGDLIIPDSVTTIGAGAFSNCSGFTGALIIPNSGPRIDGYAFEYCRFGIIICFAIMPPTAGHNAFPNYGTSLYVPRESLKRYRNGSEWNRFGSINPFDGLTLDRTGADIAVSQSLALTATVLPEGVYDLPVAWSSSDESVVTVDDAGKVTGIKIGNATITATTVYNLSAECKISIVVDTPFSFNYKDFDKTATITGQKIPSTLLFNPTIPDVTAHHGEVYSVTSIGSYAFTNNQLLGTLTIGKNITSIDNDAFSGCYGLTGDLIIPNSVTHIGSWAFFNCSGFTGTLTIPNSITGIGGWAFCGCSGFTGTLKIPNSVITIGPAAFLGCSGFTGDLIIPNSVITIGSAAFEGCSGFTGTLKMPNSVTSIGERAFQDCSGFSGDLIIPNSVITIESGAFNGCNGFNSIICSAVTPPTAAQSTFSNYDIPLYVPRESVEAYKTADVWKDFFSIKPLDEAPSGIDSAVSATVEITAIAGGVRITGAAGHQLAIFTTSGMTIAHELIGSDKHELSLAAGVYIVKVDNTVSKLVVR